MNEPYKDQKLLNFYSELFSKSEISNVEKDYFLTRLSEEITKFYPGINRIKGELFYRGNRCYIDLLWSESDDNKFELLSIGVKPGKSIFEELDEED